MDLASVVAALASVGVRVSGSTPNNNIQGDSSRACPTGLAGPEPSGTLNDPGQHFHEADSQISNGTNDPNLQHAKKRKMRKTKGEKAAGKSPTSEPSGHTRLAYRSTLEGGDKRNSHKHHQRQRPKRRAWWEVRQEAIANGPPRTPCSTRRAHTLGVKEEAYSVVADCLQREHDTDFEP